MRFLDIVSKVSQILNAGLPFLLSRRQTFCQTRLLGPISRRLILRLI